MFLYRIIDIVLLVAVASAVEFKLEPMCNMPAPANMNPSSCCRFPEVLDENIMEKCAMKVFGSGSPNPPQPGTQMAPPPPPSPQSQPPEMPVPNADLLFSPPIRCLAECIFNESGVFRDRVLLPDIAISQAKTHLQKEPDWIPAFEASIRSCKDFVSKMTFDEPKACGYTASYLIGCFNTQLFRNCPASKWKDEPGCAQLRSNTDKCPVYPALMQTQQ